MWRAFKAAREIGIERDETLVAFLRIEAFAPGFYGGNDGVHPTTHLHQLFAQFVERQIAAAGIGK